MTVDIEVFLNDLIDIPLTAAERSLYDAMDNETRASGRRSVIARLIEETIRRSPQILLDEDLHWGGPAAN